MRSLVQLRNYRRRPSLVRQRLPLKCPRLLRPNTRSSVSSGITPTASSPPTHTGHQELLTRPLRLDLHSKRYSPLRRAGVTLCVAGRPLLEVRRMRGLAQVKNYTPEPNMVLLHLPPECPRLPRPNTPASFCSRIVPTASSPAHTLRIRNCSTEHFGWISAVRCFRLSVALA